MDEETWSLVRPEEVSLTSALTEVEDDEIYFAVDTSEELLLDQLAFGGGGKGHICGHCSAFLPESSNFFQHWLTFHCQLVQPPEEEPEEDKDITIERCLTCNHVFVRGTQRHQDHELGCRTGGGGEDQQQALLEIEVVGHQKSGGKRVRAQEHRLACGVCEADVKTVTSFFLHWLHAHHKVSEVLQEVWLCRNCGQVWKMFPDSDSVASHVLNGHGAKPGTNARTCGVRDHLQQQCQMQFVDQASTDGHVQVAHSSDGHSGPLAEDPTDKWQTCLVCRAFLRPELSLSDHFKTVHNCELVWTRAKLNNVQIPQDVLQHPPRLSNGAIAKSAGGGLSKRKRRAKPPPAEQTEQLTKTGRFVTNPFGQLKCIKCTQTFTNEKLLDKHYLANHDFQCKFCDQIMDKDVYGSHLRLHLASQKKKQKKC